MIMWENAFAFGKYTPMLLGLKGYRVCLSIG